LSLTDFDWTVRSEIYKIFATHGTAPSVGEIAAEVEGTELQVREALQRLFDAHEVAPLASGDGVWMANPFSGVPTDYRVETPRMQCYANCAWDALGVPAVLSSDGWTRTHCADTGDAMEFGIRDGRLVGDTGVIHLVTPLRDAWVDIGFT
jgi:hypothetical protein